MTALIEKSPASRKIDDLGVTDHLGVFVSEWIKFWSVRSTWWCLAIFVAGQLAVASLAAFAVLSIPTADQVQAGITTSSAVSSAATIITVGAHYNLFTLAILGVLTVGSDYGSGQMRSTLVAVPRRLPVLWAKIEVAAIVVFVVALVAFVLSFVPVWILFTRDSLHANLFAWDVLGKFAGGAVYLASIAVISVAIGMCLRSSVGGVTVVMALLLVAPVFLSFIKTDWAATIEDYLPTAGAGILGQSGLDPAASALVLGAWLVGSISLGAIVLRRSDA
jgi:ABC-2 type transport system permease protein